MAKILIVEDEISIRQMLSMMLVGAGYEVVNTFDVSSAWDKLTTEQDIHLVLLDWMLPDKSGISLLKKIRKDDDLKHLPVIMLTARAEEENVLKGFENGADDYVVKPFSIKQLKARIEALLKRTMLIQDEIRYRDLVLLPQQHVLKINDEIVKISRLEFKLLHYFLINVGRACSREQLLNMVWGRQKEVTERTVDVHIRRLRKVLSAYDYDQYIVSIHGLGYRLMELS